MEHPERSHSFTANILNSAVAAAQGDKLGPDSTELSVCRINIQGPTQSPDKSRRLYRRGLLCAIYVGLANGSFLVRSVPLLYVHFASEDIFTQLNSIKRHIGNLGRSQHCMGIV